MIIKTILAWAAVSFIVLLVIVWAIRHRPAHWMRRRAEIEDGQPGGPRGRVWTDKERAEFRRARELRKLRVIQ